MTTENEFKKATAIRDALEDDGSNIDGWGICTDTAEVQIWLRLKDKDAPTITLYANGTYKVGLLRRSFQ